MEVFFPFKGDVPFVIPDLGDVIDKNSSCQLNSWCRSPRHAHFSMLTLNKLTSIEHIPSLFLNAFVKLFSPLALIMGTFTLYKFINFVWREYISNPLTDLPGPPSPSWLYGNMRQIWDSENSVMHELWASEYGNTIKYRVFLGVSVYCLSPCTLVNRFFSVDVEIVYDRSESD